MARAAHEQAFAKRTWFCTLTFRPVERARVQARASEMDGARSAGQRLVRASGEHITKYVKRLRKTGFAFRYLWVPELHRDGFPHWHGLVHDLSGNLTWERMAKQWRAGFSVIKLVRDAKALRYVTKYLSKENQGSPRASLGYGESEAERQEIQAQARAALAPHPGDDFDVRLKEPNGKSFLPTLNLDNLVDPLD